MGIFTRKSDIEIVRASICTVKDNIAKVEYLLEVGKADEKFCVEIGKIYEILKYISPSNYEPVQKIDKKISDKLDDLKILVMKAERRMKFENCYDEIRELEKIVAEREIKFKNI